MRACMLCCFSHVRLFVMLWTVEPAWLLCPWNSPGKNTATPSSRDLPNSGIQPVSLMSPALVSEFFTTSTTWEASIKAMPMVLILEKAMAHHSSTLAWKIPWTEKPGGLQSMGSQRVGHN